MGNEVTEFLLCISMVMAYELEGNSSSSLAPVVQNTAPLFPFSHGSMGTMCHNQVLGVTLLLIGATYHYES
jgi:hypothetical protein